MMSTWRHSKCLGLRGSIVLGTCVALSAMSGASAQEVKLRASGHFPAGHTASIGMEILNSELGRLTKGQVTIDYFPGSQLGGAFEGVDQVRTGQIDIDVGGPEWFGRVVPAIDVVNLPFLASGDKHAYCIIDTGLAEHLGKKSEEGGLVVLGWMSNGARHVTNNERPLMSVDDVAGFEAAHPAERGVSRDVSSTGCQSHAHRYQGALPGASAGCGRRAGEPVRKHHGPQVRRGSEVSVEYGPLLLLGVGGHEQGLLREIIGLAQSGAARGGVPRGWLPSGRSQSARTRPPFSVLVERGMQYDELSAEELDKFRAAASTVYDAAREKVGGETLDYAMSAVKACG